MMDALLFAVRDGIRSSSQGYDYKTCEIVGPDGKPPPRMGQFFVSVYEGATRNDASNNLDERYAFSVTLTMRVTIPFDRIGDQMIASKLARQTGPNGSPSFNSRIERLRAFLHMNWSFTVSMNQTPASANDNLSAWTPSDFSSTYGFVEPARYRGCEMPKIVVGDWFSSNPEAADVGIKAEMRFDGARRMQPQTYAVGPFV